MLAATGAEVPASLSEGADGEAEAAAQAEAGAEAEAEAAVEGPVAKRPRLAEGVDAAPSPAHVLWAPDPLRLEHLPPALRRSLPEWMGAHGHAATYRAGQLLLVKTQTERKDEAVPLSGTASAPGETAAPESCEPTPAPVEPTPAPVKAAPAADTEPVVIANRHTADGLTATARQGMACALLPILPSPILTRYRNKSQFNVGHDSQGRPTVGARLGSFHQGVSIGSALGSPLLPDCAVAVAEALTQFLRDRSQLPVYDTVTHKGVWRMLTVRTGSALAGSDPARSGSGSGASLMIVLQTQPPTRANLPADHPLLAAATQEAAPAENGTEATTQPVGDCSPVSAPAPASDPITERLTEVYRAEVAAVMDLFSAAQPPSFAHLVADAAQPTAAEQEAVDSLVQGWRAATSLYLEEFDGLSTPPPNHPVQLVRGAATITEVMCGLEFRVSPNAFFQVNTPSADRLYQLARELAVKGPAGAYLAQYFAARPSAVTVADEDVAAAARSVPATIPLTASGLIASSLSEESGPSGGSIALLDVCCGTGTIGLVSASRVARVVGVELSEEAVRDAVKNTRANRVNNALFVCNKAENVMRDIIDIATGKASGMDGSATAPTEDGETLSLSACNPLERVVAIVDPPRGGLHPSVIKALRTCKPLKRIVYVSCNPTGSFVEDAVRLCAPQEDSASTTYARGPPMRPVLAVPVDLFPHTPHCEMVTLFERD
jgi:tRNA/tmRNA/rRNA uracil-C5-methylase (TrmA/RlmC/RlmD family)